MIVATRTTTRDDYDQRLLTVQLHIQQNLDAELPLDQLASIAHFSPYHFHRIFRGMTGESVAQHIRRLRLERAAQRLKHSDRALPNIATEAGYDAYESFSRAFRSRFSLSPSDFRSSNTTLTPEAENRTMPTAPPISITIEKLPERKAIFVRHVGPYDQVGSAWAKLFKYAGIRFMIGRNPDMFALVHDDPEVTPPDKIRYDACLVTTRNVKPKGDIGVTTLPAGEYASTIHLGPYNTLNDSYAALCGQWLPTSGRELAPKPSIERYLNNPNKTPPEKLETRIYMPLEPLT